MFCSNCGRKLSDGARFCDYCGKPVRGEESKGETTTVGGMEARGVAETAVKARSRKPLVIIVAIIAIIALVAGFLVWRNADHKTNAPATGGGARGLVFDDSSPEAIVGTALQAGMQGDVAMMIRTLKDDIKDDYQSNLADPSSYSKAEIYKNLSVGSTEDSKGSSMYDFTVYIIRGDDAERSRHVYVDRVVSGGYRIADAEGLWTNLPDMCGKGGYAPLGKYEYSCKADGVSINAEQKAAFRKDKYSNHESFVFNDGSKITDMNKVKKVLVRNLEDLRKSNSESYQNFTYSNIGDLQLAVDDSTKSYNLFQAPITVSYDDSDGIHREATTVTMNAQDWYGLTHPDTAKSLYLSFE